jgi:ankyrin repeat protein
MTWTILHDACLHGDLSTILSRSVDFPQEICQLDEHGSTPLHLACYSYNQNMQQIIQSPRMKDAILLQDYHGNTPLHVMLSNPAAVDKNAVQSIVMTHPQVLLITNREGLTPLHVACRFIPWREDIITLILVAFPQAATMRIKVCKWCFPYPIDCITLQK